MVGSTVHDGPLAQPDPLPTQRKGSENTSITKVVLQECN